MARKARITPQEQNIIDTRLALLAGKLRAKHDKEARELKKDWETKIHQINQKFYRKHKALFSQVLTGLSIQTWNDSRNVYRTHAKMNLDCPFAMDRSVVRTIVDLWQDTLKREGVEEEFDGGMEYIDFPSLTQNAYRDCPQFLVPSQYADDWRELSLNLDLLIVSGSNSGLATALVTFMDKYDEAPPA